MINVKNVTSWLSTSLWKAKTRPKEDLNEHISRGNCDDLGRYFWKAFTVRTKFSITLHLKRIDRKPFWVFPWDRFIWTNALKETTLPLLPINILIFFSNLNNKSYSENQLPTYLGRPRRTQKCFWLLFKMAQSDDLRVVFYLKQTVFYKLQNDLL